MKGRPYNVGLDDANLSKIELAAAIQRHIPEFVFLEAPIGEDPDKRDYIVSNARLEATGFKPKYSLDEGIIELIKATKCSVTACMEMSNDLSSITAVILAGGFGNRIKHRLGSVPKPLAVVANQPFLHWIFHNLQKQGIRKIVLLTHYEADQIHEFAALRTTKISRLNVSERIYQPGRGCSSKFD